uniref:hypothetical protein n=1 Tax=Enterocloster clostridioformis TaxID=1531 RepID=UPI0026EAC837|nr:hypothetical protein [Enterocloster clostridioformis]
MGDFNQSKYINDFIKETYDTIKVQVPKGQKELIKEHAKKKGFKSVNEYMKDLITKDMERAGEKQGIHIQNSNGVVIGGANNKGIVIGDVKGNINM